MSEKRWTDDERSEAFERGLKTMEGVALELYRRGREPLLEELEEARARNADMRSMLEQVTRERDEARAACPDCAMWAERSARWHDDMQRAERERDEARAEVERLRTEVASSLAMASAEADVLRGFGCMEDGDGPCGVCRECFYRHGYRRGAEAMREACAVALMSDGLVLSRERAANVVRALPIPEDK